MKGSVLLIVDGKVVGWSEADMEASIAAPPEHFTALPGVYEATLECSADPKGSRELFDTLQVSAAGTEALFDITHRYSLDPAGWMPVFDMDGQKTVRLCRHGVELVLHNRHIDVDVGTEV